MNKNFLKGFLASLVVGLALLFGLGANAQTEIADGTNTAVTIKHRLVLDHVQYYPGGVIQWFWFKVKKNNADDTEIVRNPQLQEVQRNSTDAAWLASQVTINGVTITGQQLIDFTAKFGSKAWQDDHP